MLEENYPDEQSRTKAFGDCANWIQNTKNRATIKNNNPKVNQSRWYLKIKLTGLQNKLSAVNDIWCVTPLQMLQGALLYLFLYLCKSSEVTVLISIISQDPTPALRSLSMQYFGRICRNTQPTINAEKTPKKSYCLKSWWTLSCMWLHWANRGGIFFP